MANFMLHILKLNILAAIVVVLAVLLSRPLKKRYSSRWKYLLWLFLSAVLLFPIIPEANAGIFQIELPEKISVTRPDTIQNTDSASIDKSTVSDQDTLPENELFSGSDMNTANEANVSDGNSAMNQTKVSTEQPSSPSFEEKYSQTAKGILPDSTNYTELSDYLSEELLPSLVNDFALEPAEPRQLGERALRYERNGVSIEWLATSESESYNATTLTCSGNAPVSIYGIYCGMPYNEAREHLLNIGWMVVGAKDGWMVIGLDNKETPLLFWMYNYNGTGHPAIIQLSIDDDGIINDLWWCNWPQGKFRDVSMME